MTEITKNNKTISPIESKNPATTTTLPKYIKILNVSKKEARRVGWELFWWSLIFKKGERITILVDESK